MKINFYTKHILILLALTITLNSINACKKKNDTNITPKEYSAVKVSFSEVIIGVGNSISVEATITGSEGLDLTPKFATSNSNIVTVEMSTGLIKGVQKGDATITVSTQDGSKFETIAVKVVDRDRNVIARPSYNKSIGFFTLNGKIYDANGQQFIPMGFNGAVFWQDENCGKASIAEMKKTNANAVRLISVIPAKNSWSWNSKIQNQRALIDSCVKNKIVPILEFHDATCGNKYENDPENKDLKSIVDYWVSPELIQLCKDYEKQLIVNIANEWGPNDISWRDAYVTAVTRMRNAGINNLLMIDAGGNCGQNPNSILNWAKDLIEADEQKNVVFSQHMYSFWVTADKTKENWQFSFENTVDLFKANNIPFIIGEFGWNGTTDVRYNPELVVKKCSELGVGWFFWSWFDQPNLPFYCVVKNHCRGFQSKEDLTPAGDWLINNPVYGLKARAFRSTIY